MADETFDQWAIVEMLGHRRVAGRVREVQLAGAGFLRLDIPATDRHGEQTQYIAPGSVYALHPVSEAVALHMAGQLRPEPVHRWELPPGAIEQEDDDKPDLSAEHHAAAGWPDDDPRSDYDHWGGSDE